MALWMVGQAEGGCRVAVEGGASMAGCIIPSRRGESRLAHWAPVAIEDLPDRAKPTR